LIGATYLIPILRLETSSFVFFVEKESTEADFAIRAMKCTFRGDGACKAARHILEDKNKALKHANPTGQIPTAITMLFPDGTPARTTTGKMPKKFIRETMRRCGSRRY